MLTTSIASITPLLSIGAWSSSGASSIDTGSVGKLAGGIFRQDILRWAGQDGGDDQPERCHRDAGLHRRRKTMLSCNDGRPGDGGPMAAGQRREPMTTPAAGAYQRRARQRCRRYSE